MAHARPLRTVETPTGDVQCQSTFYFCTVFMGQRVECRKKNIPKQLCERASVILPPGNTGAAFTSKPVSESIKL